MLLEFSSFPAGEKSLSGAVAKIIDIIDKSGLPYQTHALGTVIEGDWDELLELVRKCHFCLREDFERVLTRITIDDRKGATGRLTGKVKSVESKLGREIKK